MSKALIIVESPAKARTLQRYLGNQYEVKASVGHVRDLPVKSLGVDIENDFSPQYETIRGKGKVLAELSKAGQQADIIYLAPDPDREGEAIAYHIAEALKSTKKPISRVLFHELTKKAILAAIEQASSINYRLFEAQQTRRILDRLVGYQISPLLWDKVRRGLSAGRVQSVAVRMVCEREEEIGAFKSEEYWTVSATLQGEKPPEFIAQLDQIDGKKAKVGDQEAAKQIEADLRSANFVVTNVEKKQKKRNPSPPFITSSLQIEANRKLRFSAKKTMSQAQRLYEGIELGAEGPTGLITYMRTDSTRINDDAMAEVRNFIQQTYGPELLPAKPILYKTKKSAQDAHEAIRPTDVTKTPEQMAAYLDRDMLKLYTLIWKRFVASQMAAAIYDQTAILITAGRYQLKAVGSIIRFMGFMTLYVEAAGDEAAKEGDEQDMLLPNLEKGAALTLREVEAGQHFTQPPPRYTEASLVKALEENGVGRPSTYATILSTIQEKEYTRLDQRKFCPTDLGKLINGLLLKHFPAIMDIEFTASMEGKLDQVEEGKVEWLTILRDFYGPFKEALSLAKAEMASVKRAITPTDVPCKLCDGKMVIRWGKNGDFLACETYPACKNTQDFTREADGTITPVERDQAQETGEQCEKCGKPMVYKQGKFGRFLACSGYPECRHIKAETMGVSCPEATCSGEIVKKVSKRGKVFFACNQYPKCSFAMWDKPVSTPCPQCGAGFLAEKISKKSGAKLQCVNKECGYSKSLEE
ncbi:MAG: type I DNA topoisomerase [Desulfobulbaceae bacterium]|nr:type I DNA topoisomerase [Desulfobulbaceae bacterium]